MKATYYLKGVIVKTIELPNTLDRASVLEAIQNQAADDINEGNLKGYDMTPDMHLLGSEVEIIELD